MSWWVRFSVVAVVVLTIAVSAGAITPRSMNVQGRVTDTLGDPLPAGPKDFTFSIYDDSLSGTEIWPGGGELQTITTTTDGLWTAYVGAIAPLTDGVFSDTLRWLEITVNDGVNPVTTLPRVRLLTGPYAFRVASVDGASGGTITSQVTIGPGHTNTGTNSFVAGENNATTGSWATVGGGQYNYARAGWTTIAGGGGNSLADSNSATGLQSTIGGGAANVSDGSNATVSGGNYNRALGNSDAIGGGANNLTSGSSSTVGGGSSNTASGLGSVVSGGSSNQTQGEHSTVGGGVNNIALSIYSTVSGGALSRASGAGSTIGGGQHNYARSDYVTIGGGGGPTVADSNSAIGLQSTVGGGTRNATSGDQATIGGGIDNTAPGLISVIAGGDNNSALLLEATVGGGGGNTAGGIASTVSGGVQNTASGTWSTVPGGASNEAAGEYSLAAGFRAKARDDGTFVWADSTNADFQSTGSNQFLVRASGGVGINTDAPSSMLHVAGAMATAVRSITTTTTLDEHDSVILATAGLSIWLPTAASCPGRMYFIKRTQAGGAINVNIASGSGDNIDGLAAWPLAVQYQSITIVSNGDHAWNIID